MNKTIRSILLATFLAAPAAFAQPPEAMGPGIGVMLGEPSGITLKYWIDDLTAVDLGAGWSFKRKGSVQLHSDLLYHAPGLLEVSHGRLIPYVGAGFRVKFHDKRWHRGRECTHDWFGIRVPFGLVYHPDTQPLDLFVEIAPVRDIAPHSEWDVMAIFGARYYFP